MNIKQREHKLQRKAGKIGLKLIKGFMKIPGRPVGYMLVDAKNGFHVFGGEHLAYSASLEDCEHLVADWSDGNEDPDEEGNES